MSDYDLLVIGEILAELRALEPLGHVSPLALSFSGDTLNAAVAAAAAGARTALLSVVSDDEMGEAVLAFASTLGIDVSLVRRVRRPMGLYYLPAREGGPERFIYWRRGSAGSAVSPVDVAAWSESIRASRGILVSGMLPALSTSARAAFYSVLEVASATDARIGLDPNFRPQLTSPAEAQFVLRRVAHQIDLLTPSSPGDSHALLGTDDPVQIAHICREWGVRAVAVTRGPDSVYLESVDGAEHIPVPHVDQVVDTTGAGDVFAGTICALLAMGSDLRDSAQRAAEAASASVSWVGGTGLADSGASASAGSTL